MGTLITVSELRPTQPEETILTVSKITPINFIIRKMSTTILNGGTTSTSKTPFNSKPQAVRKLTRNSPPRKFSKRSILKMRPLNLSQIRNTSEAKHRQQPHQIQNNLHKANPTTSSSAMATTLKVKTSRTKTKSSLCQPKIQKEIQHHSRTSYSDQHNQR